MTGLLWSEFDDCITNETLQSYFKYYRRKIVEGSEYIKHKNTERFIDYGSSWSLLSYD